MLIIISTTYCRSFSNFVIEKEYNLLINLNHHIHVKSPSMALSVLKTTLVPPRPHTHIILHNLKNSLKATYLSKYTW